MIASAPDGKEIFRNAINTDLASDREKYVRTGLGVDDDDAIRTLSAQIVQQADQADAAAEQCGAATRTTAASRETIMRTAQF